MTHDDDGELFPEGKLPTYMAVLFGLAIGGAVLAWVLTAPPENQERLNQPAPGFERGGAPTEP